MIPKNDTHVLRRSDQTGEEGHIAVQVFVVHATGYFLPHQGRQGVEIHNHAGLGRNGASNGNQEIVVVAVPGRIVTGPVEALVSTIGEVRVMQPVGCGELALVCNEKGGARHGGAKSGPGIYLNAAITGYGARFLQAWDRFWIPSRVSPEEPELRTSVYTESRL